MQPNLGKRFLVLLSQYLGENGPLIAYERKDSLFPGIVINPRYPFKVPVPAKSSFYGREFASCG